MASPHGPASSGPPNAPAGFINVKEAKTHLSALLARVAAGERIVLARHGKPIAQLVPLDPSPRRQLGFLQGSVDDAFFEPLPDNELVLWALLEPQKLSPALRNAHDDEKIISLEFQVTRKCWRAEIC